MASSFDLGELIDKFADSRALGKGNSSSDMSIYKSSDQVSIRSPISEKSPIQKFKYSRDPCSTVEDTVKDAGYERTDNKSIRTETSNESSVYKYSCDPCRTVKDDVEAAGYCTNCDEYLCCTCFKTHSRNKTSRHHFLMDKNKMPEEAIAFCDPCKTAGEKMEAIGCCRDCEDYLCNDCFKCHTRNKTSRHHVLLDKSNMSQFSDRNLASSVASMNICEGGYDKDDEHKKYTYLGAINIKAEQDEKDSYITGMTDIRDCEIVLADYNNKSLKVLNINSGLITRTLNVSFCPSGIALVSYENKEVAVVYCNEPYIQILSMPKAYRDTDTRNKSLVQSIDTKGQPTSISVCNMRMFVSFREPVQFNIYKKNKQMLRYEHEATIKPDSVVLKHCELPRCVVVSYNEKLLYVSDLNTGNVVSIDKEGKMKYLLESEPEGHKRMYMDQYKPRESKDKFSYEDVSTYIVCYSLQDAVYKIEPCTDKAELILSREDGIKSPQALCYISWVKRVFISSGNKKAKYRNVIKVYGLRA